MSQRSCHFVLSRGHAPIASSTTMMLASLGRAASRPYPRRWLTAAAATSKQKRALNPEQIQVVQKVEETTPPPPPSNGGGGGVNLPMLAGPVMLVAGAAYYYFNKSSAPKPIAVDLEQETTKEARPAPSNGTPSVNKEEEMAHRVVSIEVPSKMKNTSARTVVAATMHPPGGNRVSMMPPSSSTPAPAALEDTSVTEKAIAELKATTEKEATEAVVQSHQSLWAAMDQSFFVDLDALNTSQLKARIVQLATEMKDRTKWEAVRLKEFLAMKEKETADK